MNKMKFGKISNIHSIRMDKKGRGVEISEIVERGQVIIWAIIAILAVWFLSKMFFS